YHGVFDHEKRQGQKFIVDLTCWMDFQEAAATDDLAKTVSYADLADIAAEIVEGPARDLIETVATEIAEKIMASAPILFAVELTVHKAGAPSGRTLHEVAVVARRTRKTGRKYACAPCYQLDPTFRFA